MSRRKQLHAVATTALVAAFPVFPLLADEPTAVNDAASQIAVSADETPVAPDVNKEFANFNVALFEIPDGESVEFYRKRVAEIEGEWLRFALPFGEKQEEFARKTKPNVAFNQAEKISNAPIGAIYADGRFVQAPPDSVPARRAVALGDLYARLADAPELPLEVRRRYYQSWLAVLRGSLLDKSTREQRDVYAKLLADEKAKSPIDLGRVFFLSGVVSHLDLHLREDAEAPAPLNQAAAEKLLDVPEEESSEFYQKRLADLNRAHSFFAQNAGGFDKVAPALRERLNQALSTASQLRKDALKAEAKAFDATAAEKFLDVPEGESAEFYQKRYEETKAVARQVSQYSQYSEGEDLQRLAARFRTETLPEIAKRLAYADDLSPLERFENFQIWIRSRDVEGLQAALEIEIARDATSEIDACRALYVEEALAEKLIDETRKILAPPKLTSVVDASPKPVNPEAQAKFDAAARIVARLADGGAIPWKLGISWSEQAEHLALSLQHDDCYELATQLRKVIRDALADSENETDRRVLRKIERSIRGSEIIGSEIAIEARNLDGTPFDWASYRGAPVLVEFKELDPNGISLGRNRGFMVSEPELKKYEKAGLRRFTYLSAPPDAARKYNERIDPTDWRYGKTFVCSPPNVAWQDDWASQHGSVWTDSVFLFDAEGRVLATTPTPLESAKHPEIGDELRRLFPNVAPSDAQR